MYKARRADGSWAKLIIWELFCSAGAALVRGRWIKSSAVRGTYALARWMDIYVRYLWMIHPALRVGLQLAAERNVDKYVNGENNEHESLSHVSCREDANTDNSQETMAKRREVDLTTAYYLSTNVRHRRSNGNFAAWFAVARLAPAAAAREEDLG